jgi:hypothetical protein
MKCEERFPAAFDVVLNEGVCCLVDACELIEWPRLRLAELLGGTSLLDEDL